MIFTKAHSSLQRTRAHCVGGLDENDPCRVVGPAHGSTTLDIHCSLLTSSGNVHFTSRVEIQNQDSETD